MNKISRPVLVLESVLGLGLIEATIWTAGATQRLLFWLSAAWFVVAAVLAARRRESSGLEAPPWRVTVLVTGLTLLLAVMVVVAAATLHTLHGLFGTRAPLLHASMYLLWALVQQYIQQSLFFVRIEQLTGHRPLASFLAAALSSIFLIRCLRR